MTADAALKLYFTQLSDYATVMVGATKDRLVVADLNGKPHARFLEALQAANVPFDAAGPERAPVDRIYVTIQAAKSLDRFEIDLGARISLYLRYVRQPFFVGQVTAWIPVFRQPDPVELGFQPARWT